MNDRTYLETMLAERADLDARIHAERQRLRGDALESIRKTMHDFNITPAMVADSMRKRRGPRKVRK